MIPFGALQTAWQSLNPVFFIFQNKPFYENLNMSGFMKLPDHYKVYHRSRPNHRAECDTWCWGESFTIMNQSSHSYG